MTSHNEWIDAAGQCNAAKDEADRLLRQISTSIRSGCYGVARGYIESLKMQLHNAQLWEARADAIADANDSTDSTDCPTPSPANLPT